MGKLKNRDNKISPYFTVVNFCFLLLTEKWSPETMNQKRGDTEKPNE
jgi:hypothetical protein